MKHLSINKIGKRVNASCNRLMVALAGLCLPVFSALAQTGAGAFTSATTEIQTYQEPVKKLLYVIAAIIVLVGCFNVYFKMQNGDQDVKKTIMMTIGGCVAMVALANALPMFFQ